MGTIVAGELVSAVDQRAAASTIGKLVTSIASGEPFSRWLAKAIKSLERTCLSALGGYADGRRRFLFRPDQGEGSLCCDGNALQAVESQNRGCAWTGSNLELKPSLGEGLGSGGQSFAVVRDASWLELGSSLKVRMSM